MRNVTLLTATCSKVSLKLAKNHGKPNPIAINGCRITRLFPDVRVFVFFLSHRRAILIAARNNDAKIFLKELSVLVVVARF
jgi:hypothetical protein